MTTRAKLSDQVRQAVNAAGVSRYRICKDTGIDQAAFSKFMAGKVGMNLAHLDAVADVLGLDIVAHGPIKVSPRAKAGRKPKAKKGR